MTASLVPSINLPLVQIINTCQALAVAVQKAISLLLPSSAAESGGKTPNGRVIRKQHLI